MLRRLALMVGIAGLAVAATAGLIWFAGSQGAQFRLDGDTLHLAGRMDSASTYRLGIMLEENPGLTRVVLGNIDGAEDIDAVAAKGRMLRGANLAAEVEPEARVMNDGLLLLAAGVNRAAAPDARLILDGRAGDVPLDRSSGAAQVRVLYMTEMLGDMALAEAMNAAIQRGDTQTLDMTTALAYGLIAEAE